MLEALDRVHGGRGIGLGLRIPLRDRHRMLQGGAQCQALQDTLLGLRAGRLDVGVNLHGLAVPAATGPIRRDHLLHQVRIGEELVDEGFLCFPLLGKLRQAPRRGPGQNHAFHQFRVQCVACQKLLQLRQHRRGRCLRICQRLREGLFGGNVSLRSRVLALGLGQHRPAFGARCGGLGLIGPQQGGLLGFIDFRQGLGDVLLQVDERGGITGLEFAAGLGEGCGQRLQSLDGGHGG